VARWFDSAVRAPPQEGDARHIDWPRIVPFVAMHLGCLGVFAVGWSGTAIGVALALYALRMFAVTAFYHRYFSHRAFRASRTMQFIFALLGASAVQRGPLWWAAQHRHHHAHSDDPHDAHSPAQQGFWWSHIGWFLAREHFATRLELVPDLARYPELRFLDRYDSLVPMALALLAIRGG
ncbi:MAG: fatty acid desaturase, partial [Gammaproteobacteria bacterium]